MPRGAQRPQVPSRERPAAELTCGPPAVPWFGREWHVIVRVASSGEQSDRSAERKARIDPGARGTIRESS